MDQEAGSTTYENKNVVMEKPLEGVLSGVTGVLSLYIARRFFVIVIVIVIVIEHLQSLHASRP